MEYDFLLKKINSQLKKKSILINKYNEQIKELISIQNQLGGSAFVAATPQPSGSTPLDPNSPPPPPSDPTPPPSGTPPPPPPSGPTPLENTLLISQSKIQQQALNDMKEKIKIHLDGLNKKIKDIELLLKQTQAATTIQKHVRAKANREKDKKQAAELEALLQKLQDERVVINDKCDEKIIQLKADYQLIIDNYRDQISDLQSENNRLTQQLTALGDSNDVAVSQISALSHGLTQTNNAIQSFISDINSLIGPPPPSLPLQAVVSSVMSSSAPSPPQPAVVSSAPQSKKSTGTKGKTN